MNHSSMEMQLQNCFFNPAWDHPLDHCDPFESALSSIVSSPAASNSGGEGVMLKELIVRLGSICNSGEISPGSYIGGAMNSTNTSRYSTPLNSPPNLNLSTRPQLPSHPAVARYSSFSGSPENAVVGDSREGSSVSEQILAGRKRKSTAKGKSAAKDTMVTSENEESKAKKSKLEGKAKEEATENDKNSKLPEAPKDYIHVRARRGQATDSHSLAERVRREKISERMKFLQDLVPGCNKLTGKAVMLDEIITYVQSLQRQVEFLSMKLSTVNPRMDFNPEALLSKEIHQSRGSFPQGMYQLESSASAFPYGYHPQQVTCISNGTGMPLPSMDGFGEGTTPPQVSGFWEDDLQSLVQMGFGPNQPHNFHGLMAAGEMKVEQ